jgi:hypothetical protein
MTAMPRYYFNTRIDSSFMPDTEGVDLRDPDQAWSVARATVIELLREEGQSKNLLTAIIEVTDEGGEIVLEFPFSEALIDLNGGSKARH